MATMTMCVIDDRLIDIDMAVDIKDENRIESPRIFAARNVINQFVRIGLVVVWLHILSAWSVIQLARKAMLRGDHKKIEW